MKLHLTLALALAATTAGLGWSQIERLDLGQMLSKTDNAVAGKIVAAEAFRTDGQVDALYFTRLTIEGRSLVNGRSVLVDVVYPGGFVSPDEGVFNSEAPSADDVKVGNQVVAFYKWSANMGNGVAANQLYTSHGGLYRVLKARGGEIVLGRGEGYALANNWQLNELDAEVTRLATGK
jgi:hypothetical protein